MILTVRLPWPKTHLELIMRYDGNLMMCGALLFAFIHKTLSYVIVFYGWRAWSLVLWLWKWKSINYPLIKGDALVFGERQLPCIVSEALFVCASLINAISLLFQPLLPLQHSTCFRFNVMLKCFTCLTHLNTLFVRIVSGTFLFLFLSYPKIIYIKKRVFLNKKMM